MAALRLAAPAFILFVLSTGIVRPDRAAAQAGLSVTAESSYRFRGLTLTNGKPDVRMGFAYDHSSGAYAGASVIVGPGARGDIHALGYVGYLGYVRPLRNGVNLDLGVTNARIIDSLPVRLQLRTPQNTPYTRTITYRYEASYSEAYLGLVGRKLSAHLYVSPNYFGQDMTTAYLDLSGAVRPAPKVRLFWHAGLLAPLDRRGWVPRQGVHYDLRAGAAYELPQGEIQVAWSTVGPDAEYPIGYPQKRNALVVSATAFF